MNRPLLATALSLSLALPARAGGRPLESAVDWTPGLPLEVLLGLPMVIVAFAFEGAAVVTGGSVVVGYWA